jgi:hypothetical protein
MQKGERRSRESHLKCRKPEMGLQGYEGGSQRERGERKERKHVAVAMVNTA